MDYPHQKFSHANQHARFCWDPNTEYLPNSLVLKLLSFEMGSSFCEKVKNSLVLNLPTGTGRNVKKVNLTFSKKSSLFSKLASVPFLVHLLVLK